MVKFSGPAIEQPKFSVGGTNTQLYVDTNFLNPPSPTIEFGLPFNVTQKFFTLQERIKIYED